MNKEDFLRNLRKELTILKLEEIDDIVVEYDSHIAEHIANGLSEDEAIEEFGDFNQLVQGILEAYNIDSEYANSYRKKVQQKEKMNDFVNKSSSTLGDIFNSLFEFINDFSKNIYDYFESNGRARTLTILLLLFVFALMIESPWILLFGIAVALIVHHSNKQASRSNFKESQRRYDEGKKEWEQKMNNETNQKKTSEQSSSASEPEEIEKEYVSEERIDETKHQYQAPRDREYSASASKTGMHAVKILFVAFLFIIFLPFIASLFFGSIGIGVAGVTLLFVFLKTGLGIIGAVLIGIVGLFIIFVTTFSLFIKLLKAVIN
jgi:uncharacterized membrane protein